MTDLPEKPAIDRLLAVMARLRDPADGCPWDVEQTFATIAPHTIEEAYEVAETIERGDMGHLKEELGDLLFQVVFYAQMAEERSLFDFEGIAAAIAEKMIRRHPHVFGSASIDSADAQLVAWEDTKEREREDKTGGRASVLDDVAVALPALTRAAKLQKRAARIGFDWPTAAPVLDKIAEEVAEVRAEMVAGGDAGKLEGEVGDLLFACVNLARKLNIDPESALRRGNAKFERRFRGIERALAEQGKSAAEAALEELDALWDAEKRRE